MVTNILCIWIKINTNRLFEAKNIITKLTRCHRLTVHIWNIKVKNRFRWCIKLCICKSTNKLLLLLLLLAFLVSPFMLLLSLIVWTIFLCSCTVFQKLHNFFCDLLILLPLSLCVFSTFLGRPIYIILQNTYIMWRQHLLVVFRFVSDFRPYHFMFYQTYSLTDLL